MRLRRFFVLLCSAMIGLPSEGGKYAVAAAAIHDGVPELEWSPTERVLVLAPHPDDDILGCGGVVQQAVALGIPVKVVFLTNGDCHEPAFFLYRKHPVLMPKVFRDMGLLRCDEAVAAEKILGLPEAQVSFLGFPDRGIFPIWSFHWGARPPFHSLHIASKAVPYQNAATYGVPFKGEEILRNLKAEIAEFRPSKIFVSHPGDRHLDHLALYLFTRVALWDLEPGLKAEVWPYLVHYRDWPVPRGLHLEAGLSPPQTMEMASGWKYLPLSEEQREQKRSALQKHRTQYRINARALLSFVRTNELFSTVAPMTIPLVMSNQSTPITSVGAPDATESLGSPFPYAPEWKVQDDKLFLTLRDSELLGMAVDQTIFLFGYRSGRQFAQMPKLQVRIRATDFYLFDQNRAVEDANVKVQREGGRVKMILPLPVLGNPTRLMVGLEGFGGSAFGGVRWRMFKLESK